MLLNLFDIVITMLAMKSVLSFKAIVPKVHLAENMKRFMSNGEHGSVSHKVGFMFPGQGAQNVGMSKAVCSEVPAAKALFNKASNILGYDLLDKCTNGPKPELDSTVISQPAIFVSSMAALEKLKLEDPAAIAACTVAMGLSLGEYSALCFADVFSFEDGVRLTKARGEAMQAASDAEESGMLSVIGLDIEGVNKICKAAVEHTGQTVAMANYLVDGNYAISGGKKAITYAREIAKEMGARMAMPLAVAGAFHSPYMAPAVTNLRAALEKVEFRRPRIPVISNVDAKAHYDSADLKEILAQQVTSPVQWETIMKTMLNAPEFEKAYEIGPGTVCKGIVKRFGKKYVVDSVTV